MDDLSGLGVELGWEHFGEFESDSRFDSSFAFHDDTTWWSLSTVMSSQELLRIESQLARLHSCKNMPLVPGQRRVMARLAKLPVSIMLFHKIRWRLAGAPAVCSR